MLRGCEETETPHSVWHAQWIWCASGGTARQEEYVAFRRCFTLDKAPAHPVIRITASDNYCLWLNGSLVEYGPALSDPRFKRYNIIPVARYLKEGENSLAILAHHDSHCQVPYHDARGVLCQLEDDGVILLASCTSWKTLPHNAYQMTHVPYDTVSFQEHFDARAFPHDWQMPEFDDAAWQDATAVIPEKNTLWGNPLPQNRFFPWVNLIPQETASATRSKVAPLSITPGEVIQHTEFSFYDISVRCGLENILSPVKCHFSQKGNRWLLENSDPHESETTFDGIHNAVLILDFGRLLNARFGFSMDAPAGCIVEITYSESLDEGKVISYRSAGTMYADAYVTRCGTQEFCTYNWRHFRYARLTFRNLLAPAVVNSLWAETVQHPFPNPPVWRFSHPLLQQSIQATLNTVQLCVSDRTMDNPSRERKQYAGDGTGIVSAVDHLFGETAMIKKYFHQFDESQHRTGLYRYSTCHDNDGASLLDHSLYLTWRLHEHTMRFGDMDLVRRMMPGITRLLELVESMLDHNGLAGMPPYGLWFDWANIARKPISFLLNAMCARSLHCGALLNRMIDASEQDRKRWHDLAVKMTAALHDHFFDAERRAFVDYLDDAGIPGKPISEHSNSLALLWGIADLQQSDAILAHYAARHEDFSHASPGWSFLPEALVSCDRTDLFLDYLQRNYSPLFEAGRTTIPETWCRYGENTPGYWRCRNTRSLTQGTGLGLPDAVVRGIAGITPLTPGFKSLQIMPHPGDLADFSVEIHGPDGVYHLEYSRTKTEARYHASFPCEKSGRFILLSKEMPELLFNETQKPMVFLKDSHNGKKAWSLEWSATDINASIILK